MRNQIIEKGATHVGLTQDEINRIVRDVSFETGFAAEGEVQRRFIYDPDKTWRVRIRGTFDGKPALLRIENLKLEIDEEAIREKFRAQAPSAKVRPPHTYRSASFDDAKGYAWSLDEDVGGEILFDSEGSAADAVAAFVPFYRAYREAVREPFWPAPEGDAKAFTAKQLDTWTDIARSQDAERVERLKSVTARLRDAMLSRLEEQPLVFQHAHLSGRDVRIADDGPYVVFANHFWSWRQPGYDVSFPCWGQWLALPDERRTAEAVKEITETWLGAVGQNLADVVSAEDVRTMLLNRLYGSLLLDVPAQRYHHPPESVAALEAACIAEAERLLA